MEKTLIERVNRLLKEKGLTQKQLSRMSNITEASLSRYLTGQLEPKIDVVRNLALSLGVPVSYLIGDTNEHEVGNKPFEETYVVVARNKASLTEQEKTELIKLLFGEGK